MSDSTSSKIKPLAGTSFWRKKKHHPVRWPDYGERYAQAEPSRQPLLKFPNQSRHTP